MSTASSVNFQSFKASLPFLSESISAPQMRSFVEEAANLAFVDNRVSQDELLFAAQTVDRHRVLVDVSRDEEGEGWVMHVGCENSILCPDMIEGMKESLQTHASGPDEIDL